MNQQDRREFEIVHLKIDELKRDIENIQSGMEKAHLKTDDSLSFIKEKGCGQKQNKIVNSENPLVSGEQ